MATTHRSRRPRLIHLAGVVLVIVLLAGAGCISTGQSAVLKEMNSDRTAYGRAKLPTHDMLNAKAQAWAENLARKGSLSHSTLSSGLPGCWRGVGENVGYGTSAAAVQNAYMNSSGHRANVLNSTWDFVGVGYARSGSRVFTVQVFIDGCR